MRNLLLILALWATPAVAQEVYSGTGVVCDTQEEVRRFVELYQDDVLAASKQVNEETGTNACAPLTIAYIRGASVGKLRHNGKPVEIVNVVVVGILDGGRWLQMKPVEQFALFPAEGEDV